MTTTNTSNPTELHKRDARRFFEAMSRHDVDAAAALFADDFVNHSAIPEAQGVAGFRVILGKLLRAFPDLGFRCEDIIAEEDRVVCRVTFSGTNTGPLELTRFPMPATGKSVVAEQIHILRFEGHKAVEHWATRDDIGMLRQLGHVVGPRP